MLTFPDSLGFRGEIETHPYEVIKLRVEDGVTVPPDKEFLAALCYNVVFIDCVLLINQNCLNSSASSFFSLLGMNIPMYF